jgi:hypothetical protein
MFAVFVTNPGVIQFIIGTTVNRPTLLDVIGTVIRFITTKREDITNQMGMIHPRLRMLLELVKLIYDLSVRCVYFFRRR